MFVDTKGKIRTDNIIVNSKRARTQTMVDTTLHIKLNIYTSPTIKRYKYFLLLQRIIQRYIMYNIEMMLCFQAILFIILLGHFILDRFLMTLLLLT